MVSTDPKQCNATAHRPSSAITGSIGRSREMGDGAREFLQQPFSVDQHLGLLVARFHIDTFVSISIAFSNANLAFLPHGRGATTILGFRMSTSHHWSIFLAGIVLNFARRSCAGATAADAADNRTQFTQRQGDAYADHGLQW